MGETIRIEIPVSVNDNTDPGLSNITNKMNTLATAAQKVNRILSSGFKTRGIEQTAERVERTLGREHSIEVSADDNASPVLSRVEDAAESLGSFYKNRHTGTFGKIGAFSFNGNKIITSGGGGVIVTDDESLAKRAKHITTTAKIPHPYEYVHDETAYNYRLPNINAALLVAQLEQLEKFLDSKRELAKIYKEFFFAK